MLPDCARCGGAVLREIEFDGAWQRDTCVLCGQATETRTAHGQELDAQQARDSAAARLNPGRSLGGRPRRESHPNDPEWRPMYPKPWHAEAREMIEAGWSIGRVAQRVGRSASQVQRLRAHLLEEARE